MMWPLLALLTLAPVSHSEAVDVFAAACMDGSAKLDRKRVEAISHRELPVSIRQYYSYGDEGTFFRLKSARPSYLLMLKPRVEQSHVVCSLTLPGTHSSKTFSAVMKHLTGTGGYKLGPEIQMRSHVYPDYEGGYLILVSELAEFTVAEVAFPPDMPRSGTDTERTKWLLERTGTAFRRQFQNRK